MPLAEELLGALFRNASRVAERDWAAAYPKFGAPEAFAPFQLAEVCAAFCLHIQLYLLFQCHCPIVDT